MAHRLASLALVCTVIAAARLIRFSRLDATASVLGSLGRTTEMQPTARHPDRIQWRAKALQGGAVLGVFALSPMLLAGRLDAPVAAMKSSIAIEHTHVPVTSGSMFDLGAHSAPLVDAAVANVQPLVASAAPAQAAAVPAPSGQAVGASEPVAVTTAPAPAEAAGTASTPVQYVVRPGDTIKKIAAEHGVEPDALARANRLANPDHIEVGQRLRLTETAAPAGANRQPSNSPASSNEAFILSLVKGAQESQRVTGVPSSVTLAQAILETYWGSSHLAREANNYFGIKAYGKPGTAGVVWIDAWEVENGRNVTSREPFRKYNNPGESLVDHGYFFIENSRYAHAMQATDDPREFARRINRAGYATDPAYAAKLISYMDRYNLYQWDLL